MVQLTELNSQLASSREASPARTTARIALGWRLQWLGLLRIAFGIIWAIDAWFKWQPDFINNFVEYLDSALEGQPAAVQAWLTFWIQIVHVDPLLFAYLVAIGETLVAVGLLLGALSNLTYLGGALLSLVIWSTAEGFGGPYQAGSTDVGAAIIYVLLFVALYLTASGRYLGLDRALGSRLGRWSWIASGRGDPLLPVEAGERGLSNAATQRTDQAEPFGRHSEGG